MPYNDVVTTEANLLNQLKHRTPGRTKPQLLRDMIVSQQDAVDSNERTVTFAFAAGAANVAEVAITVVDGNGDTVAEHSKFAVYLSDAATGIGVTGTTASGTVAAKSASGTDYVVDTAKKYTRVGTLATGIYTLEITDSAKTAFYVAVDQGGQVTVSRVMVTGDYGA